MVWILLEHKLQSNWFNEESQRAMRGQKRLWRRGNRRSVWRRSLCWYREIPANSIPMQEINRNTNMYVAMRNLDTVLSNDLAEYNLTNFSLSFWIPVLIFLFLQAVDIGRWDQRGSFLLYLQNLVQFVSLQIGFAQVCDETFLCTVKDRERCP